MKKLLLAVVAAAMVLSAGVAGAATGSTNMNVSVTVGQTVQVSATDMNFGTIMAGDPGPSAISTITVTAPMTVPYTISLGCGQHWMGSTFRRVENSIMPGIGMDYDLRNMMTGMQWGDSDTFGTFPPAPSVHGVGMGAPEPYTVDGHLWGPTGVPDGTYTDVVLVTVMY